MSYFQSDALKLLNKRKSIFYMHTSFIGQRIRRIEWNRLAVLGHNHPGSGNAIKLTRMYAYERCNTERYELRCSRVMTPSCGRAWVSIYRGSPLLLYFPKHKPRGGRLYTVAADTTAVKQGLSNRAEPRSIEFSQPRTSHSLLLLSSY